MKEYEKKRTRTAEAFAAGASHGEALEALALDN